GVVLRFHAKIRSSELTTAPPWGQVERLRLTPAERWELASDAPKPSRAFEMALWQSREARARWMDARASSRRSRSSRRWWEARGGKTARPVTDRVAKCEQTSIAVSWCSDCGEGLKHIPERCGIVDRCDKCAKRFYSRVRKRALRAFGHAWNRRKKSSKYVILITLTVRHSGDVRADRRAIQAEWPRFRAWLHHRT